MKIFYIFAKLFSKTFPFFPTTFSSPCQKRSISFLADASAVNDYFTSWWNYPTFSQLGIIIILSIFKESNIER